MRTNGTDMTPFDVALIFAAIRARARRLVTRPKIVGTASVSIPSDMASIAGNLEVEIVNQDKNITYTRIADATQWYCRIFNYHVNDNYVDEWRVRSLTLGMEDKELLSEADNFADIIILLDYFDKGTDNYAELSFFADGWWTKTVRYLPRNEIIYQYPADGFFKTLTPFVARAKKRNRLSVCK